MHVSSTDNGFTLVELLMSVVILGVITVPLGNVVIGILQNQQKTHDRLEVSHDAQISAAYFARDVATLGVRDYDAPQSADGEVAFQTSVEVDAGSRNCGPETTPPAMLRILSDSWDNSESPPVRYQDFVAYYVSDTQLRRVKCSDGSSPKMTDIVVAHNVATLEPPRCDGAPCDPDVVPNAIELSFTVDIDPDEDQDGELDDDADTITLIGQRRQT